MASVADIKTQVEYYLSDDNLKKDAFFYNKITEDSEGWLDLEFILNCNKIKSLGIDKTKIVEAIKDSTLVESNPEGGKVRRKGNPTLPEPVFTTKKLKVAEKPEGVAVAQALGDGEKSDKFIPLILFVKDTSKLDKVIGKEFEQKLSEKIKIEVPFARIGKFDGNVVFNKEDLSEEILTNLLKDGFEYEGQKVVFELGSDKDKEEFMRNHGRHVGKIVLKKYSKEMGKPTKESKKKFKGKIEFAGNSYPTLDSLKAVFKALIVKTKNDAVIEESGKAQVRFIYFS